MLLKDLFSSRDRSRDSGNGSRTYDFHGFSTIMPTLVTDLVTPEMAPELTIFTASALSCQLS